MENVSENIIIESRTKNEIDPYNSYSFAYKDIVNAFSKFKLWNYLALIEIRRRYRRTVIGPFWTTLSIGIFILSMSIVLSALWKTNPSEFLPYFSAGYITWILISNTIVEGCTTLISNDAYLRQLAIPYTLYACLTSWRNYLVFFHHLLIFALVLIFCHHPINANIIFLVPALAITFLTSVCVCLLLGMLCARYRDIQQIINSFLQLAMFITPIMWRPEQLGYKGKVIALINPFAQYINLIRAPLLGSIPSIETWCISIFCLLILAIITFILFSKKYRTIIYWV